MMSTTGTGNAITVTALSAWELNKSTDKIEVTSFGDANKTYVQGLADIQGSFSGFWDDTDTTIFTGAASADGVKLYLYPSTDALTKYHYGPAWVDAVMSVDVNGAVTVNGTFAANGSWGQQL